MDLILSGTKMYYIILAWKYLWIKKEFLGSGNPITDENKVREVADRFRSKYSAENIAQYYSKLDAVVEFSLK